MLLWHPFFYTKVIVMITESWFMMPNPCGVYEDDTAEIVFENCKIAMAIMTNGEGSLKERVTKNYTGSPNGPTWIPVEADQINDKGAYDDHLDPVQHPYFMLLNGRGQRGMFYQYDIVIVTDEEGNFWWGRID